MTTLSDAFGVSSVFSLPIDNSSKGMEVKGVDKHNLIWVCRFHIWFLKEEQERVRESVRGSSKWTRSGGDLQRFPHARWGTARELHKNMGIFWDKGLRFLENEQESYTLLF